MWKRIREATSGFNLQYFTNIFRRRNYDNLAVPQSDEIISDTKCISDIEIATSSESGYGDDGHLDSRLSPTSYRSDSLDGIDEIEENHIVQSEYAIANSSPVIGMTGEAKDLVASYSQRRYKQLEDADEIVGIEADDNIKITEADDSGVFHSYKDTVPSKKQKRKQKRKKVSIFLSKVACLSPNYARTK